MKNNTPLVFGADSAFVVQFARAPTPGAPRPGRAEHINSGRATRFQDAAELMAFVARVLAELAAEQPAETL